MFSGNEHFEEKQKRKPKSRADDSNEPAVILLGEEKFRIESFNFIIDSVVVDLKRRITAYEAVDNRFNFLHSINEPQTPEVVEKVQSSLNNLVEFYSKDLNKDICAEWDQWKAFILNKISNRSTAT